eukprot:1381265-Prymnesium_polylepis.1
MSSPRSSMSYAKRRSSAAAYAMSSVQIEQLQLEYNAMRNQLKRNRRASANDHAKVDEFVQLQGNSLAAMGNRAVLALPPDK